MSDGVNIVRSRRLEGVGEYYFSRKLREIANIEATSDRKIVKLAMGGPDTPPAQDVIDRLAKEARRPDVHRYMSFGGEPILREAFAEWYDRWYGVTLDPHGEILPLMGSKEGLMHICMAFLNEGDRVLVPNPGYPTYSAAVHMAGGVMVQYPLSAANDFLPDFDAMEHEGLEGVKIMLVNYPNMPTGQTPTKELFERIVRFGRKHNILIIHDNPYSFIRNKKPMSIMSVKGAREVCMELNSLSKSHSMAGWRVGVLVGRSEWIREVLRFKSNMDTGMFYPIQAAAQSAMELGKNWFRDLNEIYADREKIAYEILDTLGCTYRVGQAGLFVWAEIPRSYEGDSYQFSDEVMAKCDVFITPGAIFGSEGLRYLRVTLCCSDEQLALALQQIRERFSEGV